MEGSSCFIENVYKQEWPTTEGFSHPVLLFPPLACDATPQRNCHGGS